MDVFFALSFVVVALVALAASMVGHRGNLCDEYPVPARVCADPVLVRRANRLVMRWCCAASVLSIPPVALIWEGALAGSGDEGPSILRLLAFAIYAQVPMGLVAYAFERVARLAADAPG